MMQEEREHWDPATTPHRASNAVLSDRRIIVENGQELVMAIEAIKIQVDRYAPRVFDAAPPEEQKKYREAAARRCDSC